jgi:glutathione synthase/RimK-type ligase-like ATP-grasp enzyme
MITVGIFGRRNDPQVTALQQALESQGARAHVVDFHAFPRFNLATIGRGCQFDDIHRPQPIPVDALDLVHLRSACFEELAPSAAAGMAAEQVTRHHREQGARLVFQLALARLLARRIPVVNPPGAFRFHRQKAHQHQLLVRHGIPTPAAVVTNDVRRARAFIEAHGERVVAKPLASGAEVVLADLAFLAANADRIRNRPFIFQRYVKGRSLRLYLLGGRIASMGVVHHDQRHVDWRERTERVERCEPDPELAHLARRAARLLDLPYCGIDVEEDAATGQRYFLDFNPSALFVGYGRLAGVDIARALASYLLAVVRRGQIWSDPGGEPDEREGHR